MPKSRWVMSAVPMALPLLGAGCQPPSRNQVAYVAVVDDAQIRSERWDATQWCRTGPPESVYLAATFGSGIQTTPAANGLQPSWRAPIINAVAWSYSLGTLFDVVGLCPGDPSPLRLGAALLHPSATAIEKGGVSVRNFGGVSMLRFHFVPASKYAPPPGGTFEKVPEVEFWPIDVVDNGSGVGIDDGTQAWFADREPPPPSVPCDCTTTGGGAAGGGLAGGEDGAGGGIEFPP